MLERELRELRAENESLRARKPEAPPNKLGGFALIVFILALVALGMAVLAGWTIPTRGDDLGIALSLVATFLLALSIALGVVSRLLIMVPPDKMGVLSGRRMVRPDGSTRPYRVVFGGRVFRMPIVERYDEMDLTPIEIDSRVRGAYTRGGVAVDIRFRARVEIARHEALAENAIERFLGRSQDEIARVARESLEGILRGIASQLTVDELCENATKVADSLIHEAEDDLMRLGLSLEAAHLIEVEPR